MEVFFLIGAIQAFFLAVILLGKRNKGVPDKVLFVWLLFMGLHILTHYLYSIDELFNLPILSKIALCFPMLEGPFVYIYVRRSTNANSGALYKELIHGLPYFVLTLLLLFNLTIDPLNPEKSFDSIPTILIFVGLFNVFLGPIYMVLSLIKLKKHRQKIRDNFSFTEQIELKWLHYVVIIMCFVWLMVILTNVFSDYLGFIPSEVGDHIIYVFASIAIFFYGYFGLKQQVIYEPIDLKSKEETLKVTRSRTKKVNEDRYEKSSLKKTESSEHLQKLLNFMDDNAPYLREKLTLNELASELDLSVHHLSQVINENLGKNFFDFINHYRVEMIKEKMADPSNKNFTLLALAFDSGFNSKSSFNSIFKKITGLTPSQYLKSLKD